MALFKSGVIASASGSLGGITFSHNKGGMYIRNRTIPTDPASSFQQAVRNRVSQLTTYWQSVLSAAQRESWETYALNVPLLNPFGEARNVTGLNMFVRSNVERLNRGATQINLAPGVFNLGEATAPSIDSITVPSTVNVAFTATDAWVSEDDAHMFLYISRPQGTTINYFKNPYRYAGKIDGDSSTPPTSPAAITSPFIYTDDPSQRMFLMARVSRADGRLTTPFRVTADT